MIIFCSDWKLAFENIVTFGFQKSNDMINRTLCIIFCVLIFPIIAFCQPKLCKVLDEQTKEPLIGVNVTLGSYGTSTDVDGHFSLITETFPVKVTLSYIGYNTLQFNFLSANDLPAEIYMSEIAKALDLVTVTGSRYEQNINKATVSVDILKPDLLRSVNAVSSDKILNKVSGVQILDGQANIRGGSGYSYGAGSRVMLLIDDIPALQPDAGFPNWNDIPIENLSQIEIVKGAASALYGSAALNGIINFRSSYAKSTPETRFSIGGNIFLSPKDKSKKWWGNKVRYDNNYSFVHKQKFGKLDFIGSGMYYLLEGYNQFTNERRGRANVNLRYRYSDALTFQLSGMVNSTKSNSFFIWKDGKSGAMQPFDGTVSDKMSTRIYIDPSVTFYDTYKNRHKLMGRTILIDNKNNTNQSNNSVNQYLEYQFQRKFDKAQIMLTTGIVASWNKTNSQILGDTTFTGQNHAAYVQADKTFFDDKLTISGGLRYEYIKQNSPAVFDGVKIPDGEVTDDKLIGRLSANYKLAQYSSLRASYGQGYRYPTLTERFVTTTFGIFSIFSNPLLQPETGWSSELGFKQGFALGGFKGYLDAAAFISEYENMIEFTFLGLPKFGFKPLNVGDTRISGLETGIAGEFNFFDIPIKVFGGYTYINPIYKNFASSDTINTSISEAKAGINVLKYRSKHQIKMDAEAKISKFKWGISYQYTSHFINIDRAFEEPFYILPITVENPDVFGIAAYRDSHNKGYHLIDTRISYEIGVLTITALLNNVFNIEYTLRPALIEAPRNIGLRIDVNLK